MVVSSVFPRYPQDAEVPWMRESLLQLGRKGVQVQVLAPSWKGLASHSIDGISVHRFRYAPASLEILTHDEGAPSKLAKRPWMQLLAIPYVLSGAWSCLRICLRQRPDVIHAHWPFPHGFIALVAKWFFRVPMVLNFHGAELLLMRKHPWVRYALRFVLKRADAVLCNSSFTADKVKAIYACEPELSPYGTPLVSADSLPAVRTGYPFRILFVGRHIERKGLEFLIHAASHLDPQRFQVRIVGQGDMTQSLKEQAERCASRQVVFPGKLSAQDLEKEYREASCFVLPAVVDSKGDTEGLGVVLIEAAELGLPLVASNVGGIPDVVVDGESGLLVPQRDIAALAGAFERLAADPSLAHRLVQGAQARIRARFSWSQIVAHQMELYERLRLRRG